MKLVHNSRRLIATALSLAVLPGSVYAENESFLEEITVTAQKRVQSVQDVGITISVLTGDDLTDSGVGDLLSIGQFVPGLDIKASQGNHNQMVSIRGIGLRTATPNTSPSAGVHIDDIYMSTPAYLSFPLFDLDRVEVLKGPQGTLFGKNTTAGTINFITRKPTQEQEGYITLSYGRFNAIGLEGAIGGGLSETLSGRVALKYSRSDGHQENLGTAGYDGFTLHPAVPQLPKVERNSNWGGDDRFAIRGTLLWEPSDEVSITASLHHLHDQGEIWQFKTEGVDRNGFVPTDDPHEISTNEEPSVDLDMWGGLVRAEWDLGNTTLISLTGFEFLDRFMPNDEGSPTRLLQPNFENESNQFSQEIRLQSNDEGPFYWQIGAFYAEDSVDFDRFNIAIDLIQGASLGTRYKRDTEGWALFANTEYSFTDQFKLIAGVRYLEEKRDFDLFSNFRNPYGVSPLPPLFPDLPIDVERNVSEDDVIWKLGLDWTPTDNALVYASVSTGFKSGGFDGTGIQSVAATFPYGSESLKAYEVGFKTTWEQLNIRLNGSLFYYDYDNIQAEATVNIKGFGLDLVDNVITNAGVAEISGGELEFVWQPLAGLVLSSGLSVLDTELTDFNSSDPVEVAKFVGNQLPDAPELTINAKASYEWAISSNYLMKTQLDVAYSGETYRDIDNSEALMVDSYSIWNTRIELSTENGRWSLGAWVRNLADEEYITSSFFGFGGPNLRQMYGLPRTFGIDLTINM